MHEADLVKPVQKFVSELEKAGGKPLYELTPQEARQVLREVQKEYETLLRIHDEQNKALLKERDAEIRKLKRRLLEKTEVRGETVE